MDKMTDVVRWSAHKLSRCLEVIWLNFTKVKYLKYISNLFFFKFHSLIFLYIIASLQISICCSWLITSNVLFLKILNLYFHFGNDWPSLFGLKERWRSAILSSNGLSIFRFQYLIIFGPKYDENINKNF